MNKYQPKGVKVGAQYQEKFITAGEDASARGFQQEAQQQQQLKQQHDRGANIAVNALSSKLTNFATQFDRGVTDYLVTSGKDDAIELVNKKNDYLHKIDMDTTLTQDEKDKAKNGTRIELDETYNTIYNKAYNGVIEADYTRTIKIDATTKATQAMNAAKGDPETFKKAWGAYTTEAMKGAPTKDTKSAAYLAYKSQGIATYRHLFTEKQKQATIKAKENMKTSDEILKNTYKNEVTGGNAESAKKTLIEYVASKKQQVQSGVIGVNQAQQDIDDFTLEGVIHSYTEQFNLALQSGDGKAVYDKFVSDMGTKLATFNADKLAKLKEDMDKSLKHLEGEKRKEAERLYKEKIVEAERVYKENTRVVEKEEKRMETEMRSQYKDLAAKVIPVLDIGGAITASENADIEKLLLTATPTESRKLKIKLVGAKIYQDIRSRPLSEQEAIVKSWIVTGTIDRNTNLPTENAIRPEIKDHVLTIIKNKKAYAEEDSITLGIAEGLIDETNLDVAALFTSVKADKVRKNLKDRVTSSSIMNKQYDTNTKQFFKKNEVISITEMLQDGSVPESNKIIFIKNLSNGIKDISIRQIAFRQLGIKDSSFLGSAKLIDEGAEDIALKVLKGTNIINSGFTPNTTKIKNYIYSSLPSDVKLDPIYAKTMSENIAAVFVTNMTSKGWDGETKLDIEEYEDEFEQARTSVMGKKVIIDTPSGDKITYAPLGVSVDDFEDWIDFITEEDDTHNKIALLRDRNLEQTKTTLSFATPVKVSRLGYKFIITNEILKGEDGKDYILEYEKK